MNLFGLLIGCVRDKLFDFVADMSGKDARCFIIDVGRGSHARAGAGDVRCHGMYAIFILNVRKTRKK